MLYAINKTTKKLSNFLSFFAFNSNPVEKISHPNLPNPLPKTKKCSNINILKSNSTLLNKIKNQKIKIKILKIKILKSIKQKNTKTRRVKAYRKIRIFKRRLSNV